MAKRWAAYGKPENGRAALLGVVDADGEKPAIKAAMAMFKVSWRGVFSVRVLDDDVIPAEFLDARKPGEPRPWDGVELEFHDLCTMFPPMADDVFGGLVESVREHGAMRPVVLHEGKILDGRHAYRAYREVGIPFNVVEWAGEYATPLKFVLAANLVRRDLTASQRAALAVEVKRRLNIDYRDRSLANLKKGDESPESRVLNIENSGANAEREAAKALNVSNAYVHAAEKVAEASPETFEQVKRGEKTLYKARKDLGLAKPKAEPKPEPADSGRVVVNGERRLDAAVERDRAAGVIPAGVEVVVEDPGEDAGDVVEAIREERAEQAAKADDVPDDEWLATLPLNAKLEGVSLSRFRADALFYRRFEQKARGSLKAFYDKARKEYRGTFRGLAGYAVERLLRIQHPGEWKLCPPPDKEGCGGTGSIPILSGECQKCHGRGYVSK